MRKILFLHRITFDYSVTQHQQLSRSLQILKGHSPMTIMKSANKGNQGLLGNTGTSYTYFGLIIMLAFGSEIHTNTLRGEVCMRHICQALQLAKIFRMPPGLSY